MRYLYADIREIRVNKQKIEQPYDWFDQLPEEKRRKPIGNKEALFLSSCLGDGHDVFLALDLEKSAIEIAVRDFRNKASKLKPSVQLLCKWTERNGSNATYDLLINGLKEFEDYHPGLIEWGKIQNRVMK
ncbi:Death domain-containing protein cradd [Biomphalaria glabrata]|nr:hypothetical protein BgiMline_030731 [Biomphalaria glabrata]